MVGKTLDEGIHPAVFGVVNAQFVQAVIGALGKRRCKPAKGE